VPLKTDKALRWSESDPFALVSTVESSSWQVLDKGKKLTKAINVSTPFVSAKGSIPVKTKKHMLESTDVENPRKKIRASRRSDTLLSPLGLAWDNDNYSCGYDSLFVILYNIWQENPQESSLVFQNLNKCCASLSKGFQRLQKNQLTFEQVRDNIRSILHRIDPVMFPTGLEYIDVSDLAKEMFKVRYSIASSQKQCSQCDYAEELNDDDLSYVLHADHSVKHSTNNWINTMSVPTSSRCLECNHKMKQFIFYNAIPHIVILKYPMQKIKTSHSLKLFTNNSETETLKLKGIVYHGGYHFTSRIVTADQQVWYHDGITTGQTCIQDGILANITDERIKRCKNRDLVLAIYAQDLNISRKE